MADSGHSRRDNISVIGRVKWYMRILGTRGVRAAIAAKISRKARLFKERRSEIEYPFFLRIPSSDVPTYEQIFIRRDYEFEVTRDPVWIIDAGANIGLASIYFANKFPKARIIAIEPESKNFELLKRNTAPYANVIPVHAALWNLETEVDLVDTGFGHWAFVTQKHVDGTNPETEQVVRTVTVDSILKDFQIERLDILKMDIESAEKEVFEDPSSWISRVDSVIVELHENRKVGCSRNFYNTTNGFDDEWIQGENVYLTRRAGCVRRQWASVS